MYNLHLYHRKLQRISYDIIQSDFKSGVFFDFPYRCNLQQPLHIGGHKIFIAAGKPVEIRKQLLVGNGQLFRHSAVFIKKFRQCDAKTLTNPYQCRYRRDIVAVKCIAQRGIADIRFLCQTVKRPVSFLTKLCNSF